MKRKLLIPGICLIGLLSSCFNPTTTAPPPAADSPAPAAEDNNVAAVDDAPSAASSEARKLVIWDGGTEGDTFELYQGFADGFAAEYGVEVERLAMRTEDLRNTIRPAINSGEGPDVFSYDPGAGYLGVLAYSGLALDLTDGAQTRGWYGRHMDWTLDQCSFNGKLYGIGNQVECLGVFYNKEIFAEHNVQLPKTYNEFLDACETLKTAGVLPLMIDDLDQWPGFHLESMWLNSFAGPKAVADVLALRSDWLQPDFASGLDALYATVVQGYTPPTPNAISYDDANNQFTSGEAAMRATGGWMVDGYTNPEVSMIADHVGFFLLPSANGMPTTAPGGIGEAWVISSRIQNPDVAMDYFDYMFTGERIQAWLGRSYIPSVTDVDISGIPGLNPLFVDYAATMMASEDTGFNIDVLMPALVNDVTRNIMQALLAGKIDGMAYLQEKQDAWQKEIDAGNYEAIG